MEAPGIRRMASIVRGMAHWNLTSLSKALSRANALSLTKEDLWFPRAIICVMSFSLSSSEIGVSGYDAPLLMMSLMFCHCGWCWRRGAMTLMGLNSAP